MTLVGVRAQPVHLYWVGSASAALPSADRPILYLGQANGTLVLYEVNGGRVDRMPANAVLIRSIDTGIIC
jgi:hypothetical protein